MRALRPAAGALQHTVAAHVPAPWLPACRRHQRGARQRAGRCVAGRLDDELREMAAERAGKAVVPAKPGKGFGGGGVDFARSTRPKLAVLRYPDPRLRAPNADVTRFDAALATLAADMFALMYRTDGVGLAAPQVGVNQRLLVYNPEGVKGKGVEVVLCNPVLVEASAEQELFEEGCLSFPGIYANILRPLTCVVDYQDAQGVRQRMALDGFQARLFQHEFDHLQGVLFHDRMAPAELEAAQPRLTALEREFKSRQL